MSRIIVSQFALVFLFSACSTQRPVSIPVGEVLSNQGYHIVKQVQHVKNYHVYNWISVETSNVIKQEIVEPESGPDFGGYVIQKSHAFRLGTCVWNNVRV
jgi:hypothetical protein